MIDHGSAICALQAIHDGQIQMIGACLGQTLEAHQRTRRRLRIRRAELALLRIETRWHEDMASLELVDWETVRTAIQLRCKKHQRRWELVQDILEKAKAS